MTLAYSLNCVTRAGLYTKDRLDGFYFKMLTLLNPKPMLGIFMRKDWLRLSLALIWKDFCSIAALDEKITTQHLILNLARLLSQLLLY